MRRSAASSLRFLLRSTFVTGAAAASVLTYWMARPNLAPHHPGLAFTVESLPSTARHDGMSDLIRWHGYLWLAHTASPWHFASTRSRIVLRRSTNGRLWEDVTAFSAQGEDVRDPKLAVFGDRLHLYWLQNREFPEPRPYGTFVATSSDGIAWGEAAAVKPAGWLLWRPQTADGVDYYVTAYRSDHERVALFRSRDGSTWSHVSDVPTTGQVDETDFTFVGRHIVATTRLEGVGPRPWLGDPRGATVIASTDPPYERWTTTIDRSVRLDGPRLFTLAGRAYAVGRFDPLRGGVALGSILSRKRTALYLVEPHRLELLTLLPSAGDTSYAGVVVTRAEVIISYYTSRPDRDYPWLLGMLLPSELRLARIPLLSIEALADSRSPAGAGLPSRQS